MKPPILKFFFLTNVTFSFVLHVGPFLIRRRPLPFSVCVDSNNIVTVMSGSNQLGVRRGIYRGKPVGFRKHTCARTWQQQVDSEIATILLLLLPSRIRKSFVIRRSSSSVVVVERFKIVFIFANTPRARF